MYFSADCGHGWNFKSICIALLVNYFENEDGKHLVGPRYDQKIFMNEVTGDESWMHYFEPHRKISNQYSSTKSKKALYCQKDFQCKKVMHVIFFTPKVSTSLYTRSQVNKYKAL